MRVTVRHPKQHLHRWRYVLGLLLLALISLWTLSRAPRFEHHHKEHSEAGAEPHGDTISLATKQQSQQQYVDHGPLRILLATHNRLLWYYPDTQQEVGVHEGQGVYYGTFPGDPDPERGEPTAWVVSRPHNWHPTTTTERLLNINLSTGELIKSVQIPSRFSHDAVRSGNTIWLCNTGEGKLVQLSYPSMDVVRTLDLFTVKEHINTVAAFSSASVWVVLHNLGKSAVVEVELATGQIARRYDDVGMNAHGLVMWRGLFVLLSSKETSLITLNPATNEVTYVWKGDAGFLKGLTVVDDVAYFGMSPPMARQDRDGPTVECDVVAVSLETHQLLFRHQVQTHGLLNVVSAPHLSEASTYVAQHSGRSNVAAGAVGGAEVEPHVVSPTTMAKLTVFKPGGSDVAAGVATSVGVLQAAQATGLATGQWSSAWLDEMLDPSIVAGVWPTSMPRMDMVRKVRVLQQERLGRRNADGPLEDFPSHAHLGKVTPDLMQPAKEKLAGIPPEWWDPVEQAKVSAVIADREDNLNKIKPGVRTMFLIFSSRSADRVWELPLYKYFAPVLDPILHATIGESSMKNIIRLQLAQMTPGAHIKAHRDTGPWAEKSHRIHVVLKTNPSISFFSCPKCHSQRDIDSDPNCQAPPHGLCTGVNTAINSVFEINNLMIHEVRNEAEDDRVHLVADVLEEPAPERVVLTPGQRCHYISHATQPNNPGC